MISSRKIERGNSRPKLQKIFPGRDQIEWNYKKQEINKKKYLTNNL